MKLKELFKYTGGEQIIHLIVENWRITAKADALECCLNDDVLISIHAPREGSDGLQGALTRGEMADGFNTAQILRNQSDITRDQFGLQRDVLENRFTAQQCCCQTQQNIMQNRYDAALGNAATQREILDNRYNTALGFQAVQAQNAECCCDIKTAIHAEGEATRALINANVMQELRDNLQAAQLQLGTLSQTNTLLNAINKTPVPAYLTCSPYQTTYNPYAGNGCGCGSYAA